jgi:deoxyribose-phosphate aldolase
MSVEEFASYFDHTALKAEVCAGDIDRLCDEAERWGFWSVCVGPRWVGRAAERLDRSDVRVCSVVGFPLGADCSADKAEQARRAIYNGADEIDMAGALGAMVDGDVEYYAGDVCSVKAVCVEVRPAVCLKVIIESAALRTEQIRAASRTAEMAGADIVKTSTGFHSSGGASTNAVQVMRDSVERCGVKASGGIGTLDEAMAMIDAGANRIGASKSVGIIEEFINAS